MNKENYTSNVSKLIANSDRFDNFRLFDKLSPITLDIAPTNVCNLDCSFCTVKNRDRSLELSLERVMEVTNHYFTRGLKSIELTGGGEPTLWKYFNEYIDKMSHKDYSKLKIGLITNGINLKNIPQDILSKFTWIRVSLNGLDQGWTPDFTIPENVDLSFNYVYSIDSKIDKIKLLKVMDKYPQALSLKIQLDVFDKLNRLDTDYYQQKLWRLKTIDKKTFISKKPDISKADHCFMGWVKPHLHADGNIYRCSCNCLKDRKFDPNYIINLEDKCDWETFDTSKCHMCFFKGYNDFIGEFKKDIRHKEFV